MLGDLSLHYSTRFHVRAVRHELKQGDCTGQNRTAVYGLWAHYANHCTTVHAQGGNRTPIPDLEGRDTCRYITYANFYTYVYILILLYYISLPTFEPHYLKHQTSYQ